MKTFPMFIKVDDGRIVVIGGGEAAAQKARLALKTEAEVVVVASVLSPELAALAAKGRLTHRRPDDAGFFENARLVFVATGCAGADAAWRVAAKAAGAGVVNVVDAPDLCDAFTPAIVDRDPVVVAVGTEGKAPVLARQIKSRIEEMLEPGLGGLVTLAGRLRRDVAHRITPMRRRAFWSWAFSGAPRLAYAAGDEARAARLLTDAITAGGDRAAGDGFVSLVGAGPGAKDLITLRGVKRLQEADVILYDRLLEDDILELARRDAKRVYVGKTPGASSWPQEKIDALIVAEALRGKRVVRLKCGDPAIFARAAEEVEAMQAAGVPFEIVPGVTAASAAAAAMQKPLTERGKTDAIVFATATDRNGAAASGAIRNATPGTSIAIYMGVGQAAQIQGSLMEKGQPADLEVDIVHQASRAGERIIRSTLSTLKQDLARAQIRDTAILLLSISAAASKETAPYDSVDAGAFLRKPTGKASLG